ncbi:OTU-like cysteine protease domain-containing protein, putative [Eimeria brunetti]|uniref:OTU-like cysteine protease domain-containing protein, putative n=1 Tax=Eimeria brunetti TaxID=51314 RepID=U6LXT9_9EIME|nr:OTU-like cysteine protease domain-containing protein, putative [Eimeria brunetti]
MLPAEAQQHSGSLSCAMSGAAADGTSPALEGTEYFRLGNDLESTHVVRIACHCCKATNTLICSKTPDGGWLLRRAHPTTPARTVPAADQDDPANQTPFDAGGGVGEGFSGITDLDSWATDSEKDREQEGPIKVAAHPASDSNNNRRGRALSEERGSEVGGSQASQRGTSCRSAVQATPQTTAAAGAAALAIAAPEPKRDTAKTAPGLRPFARNSNSSTCSSWEGGDPRVGDEPSSPMGIRVPIQTTQIHEFRPLVPLVGEQQKEQQQLYGPERQQTTKKLLPHHQLHAARSPSSSSRMSHQISNKAAQGNLVGVTEHQHHNDSYKGTWKKAHSDGETSEGSPKQAVIKGLQRSPTPNQLLHLEESSPEAEDESRKCGKSCSSNSTDGLGCSTSNSSTSSRAKAQHDNAIAAMAPFMLTRECEGDGNCLYRAFSDQLYGSQEHHLFLRRLAVDVMSRCKDTFEAFVDESEGPFERWLQTKKTYGEWADYREMHALLLLFGNPIFVFDERLQLLQAFEPDAEKRRPPSQEGNPLTPFRLMWHGKLGHYTSLHYVKEGFPIARGLTIGELEAEGLARLVLSVASGGSSDSPKDAASRSLSKESVGAPAGVEEEALAECLQVSAQDLAGIAAEQEIILAAIKRQRLRQLLPQTTRIVNELWSEAKKEQEAWTAGVTKGVRGSPLVAPAIDPSQHQSLPGRVTEIRSPSTAAAAAAAEGSNSNLQAYYPSGRGYAGSFSGVVSAPVVASSSRSGGSAVVEVQQMSGPVGGLLRESRPGQNVRYDRPQQQVWQEQLHLRQQATAAASPPIVCHSQGPPGPVLISSPVGPALLTPTAQGVPASTASRNFTYTHQFTPRHDLVEQQRHCVRLADGRLVALAPSRALGPVRHGTLQQQRLLGQQPPHLLPPRAAGVSGQRQGGSSSNSSQTEEIPWFMRWMGSGSNSQGR